uniref:S8 family peptidase n=1 Tax=Sphingomonas bacterium TaxID=1895847 RepID=UPI002623FE0B|nr:S8 family peptidase [Sphingomonas bacterium]
MARNRSLRACLLATAMAVPVLTLGATGASAQSTATPTPTPSDTPAPSPTPTPPPTTVTIIINGVPVIVDIGAVMTPIDQPIVPTTNPVAPLPTAARPTIAYNGDLKAQVGNIRTFMGNIRTFWGDASPFFGNIRTFWGDASPFDTSAPNFWGNLQTYNGGAQNNVVAPTMGNIRTFWSDLGPTINTIHTSWTGLGDYTSNPLGYAAVNTQLLTLIATSQATWGAAVQAQTGKSFADGFARPLLSKYGIDLSNPQSLANLAPELRDQFFFDWYDGLMNFSGTDHVDHWMKEINWTPALTQTLGNGRDATIGLLDFTVTGDGTQNILKYSGISDVSNGHGSAVASLMIGAHDGRGVMGIAPQASVVAYNPFDATQTAGWTDITKGIVMLAQNGANVVNMSLGVPGWTLNPGWNTVFKDESLSNILDKTVFVIAAGNTGTVQSQNIAWDKHNPSLIVVGSVDPSGTISSFSNTPGTTCLLDKGSCKGDYLMNHFIVAPGEGILVDDGNGGVTRMSGTSFAAPLVTGTIALIDDRWPWLTDHPKDVVHIILASARDLGAPGVDPIYGYGELDVLAALSPLDWNALTWKQSVGGKISDLAAKDLRATTSAQRATWEVNGVFFSAFERTGESFRDFEIPLSSKLSNQTVSINGANEQFMTYLQGRFSQWLGLPTKFAGVTGGFAGFTDRPATGATLRAFGDMQATLSMTSRISRSGFRNAGAPFQTALHLNDTAGNIALDFGSGEGAVTAAGQEGFAMTSDFNVQTGGANPFLGLASGGAFARMSVKLAPTLTLSSSVTQRALHPDFDGMSLEARRMFGGFQPYSASAGNMALAWQASSRFTTSIGYTMLHERTALLGTASADQGDLPHGSYTDAATATVAFAPTSTFSIAATATAGRSRAGTRDGDTGLAIGRGGLISSAYQLSVSKTHLLDRNDRLRFSFSQPMHVEHGTVDYSSVAVVDRNTGELGVITQHASITAAPRYHVAEMIYGRSFLRGAGQVSLFGQAAIGNVNTADMGKLTVGGSVRLAF